MLDEQEMKEDPTTEDKLTNQLLSCHGLVDNVIISGRSFCVPGYQPRRQRK